ncbi:SpoIIE family protein phosphatase [Intrasporangium sp.]|uniref:SpoIIE family protein phosphatase n=1 Tax=Intrasporangium sp. TaxID=1925024 RepID=UPI002D77EC10|nr:SpoIIE family protein phosphatase [Intrasporangium sp.]
MAVPPETSDGSGAATIDFRALFDIVPSACVVLDPDLVIRDCNEAYVHVVGHTKAEMIGRGLFQVFPDISPVDFGAASSVRDVLQTALSTKRPTVLGMQRYDISRPAGAAGGVPAGRYWAGTAVPLLGAGGDARFVLWHVFEVTALASRLAGSGGGEREAAVMSTGEAMRAAMALMEQAHLFDEEVEAERRLGVAVQSAMLPTGVPDTVRNRVAVAVRYRPASTAVTVGGDWYDVTDIGDGRVAVAVGDVVGHGLVAASVMGQLRSALAALTVADVGPPQALAALDQIARHNPNATASTAVKLVLDPELGFAAYSSAGHLPPLLAHADGRVDELNDALGPPLAVTEQVTRRPLSTVNITPGNTLLLYTDGLVERRDEALDVGIDRLKRALARHRHLGVEDLADRLLEELAPGSGLRDDVAMVLLRP